MNKLKFILMTVSAILSVSAVKAQTPSTLQQCIDSALKYNLSIRSARFDVDKANEQKKEAFASFLPQVNANGQYEYYTKVPTQLIPSAIFAAPSASGAKVPKYVAGSFTLPQSTQGSVSLTHTLYNGQVLIAFKAAKANISIYELQLKSSKEDLAYNVGAAYYNIQALTKKIALLTDNIDNLDKIIKSTKLNLDNGIATKTDYNRLLVNRESTEATIVSTQGQLDEQLVQLKFLMGKPLSAQLAIQLDSGSNSLNVILSPDTGNSSKRTDIQLLQAQKNADEIQRKNIKAGYQPILTLTNSFGVAGYNDRLQPFQTINNQWFNNSSISLNLSIPIFDGGKKRSQVRQKNIELEQYDAKIQYNKQQADKEELTAFINYNTNVVNLRYQYANVDLANKIYIDRQLQYQNGIVSLKDVLDSKNDLLDAENTFITSLVNARTSELDLKKAKGELLTLSSTTDK